MSAPSLVLGAMVLLALAACRLDAQPAGQPDGPQPSSNLAIRLVEASLIEGPVSPDGLQAILGTSDLATGPNRVGIALVSPSGLVRAPAATVSSYYVASDGTLEGPRQTTLAVFRPWPYGSRGLYTARLDFDRPGRWRIDISAHQPGGVGGSAQLEFDVRAAPLAPAVGSPAIKSVTRTASDVPSLDQLTTGSLQDPELYQVTIREAVESGRPSVVVFASPAFCTNAVCGPQVEVLQELKNRYRGRANFIHVDLYDNPHEIQGDLEKARLSPAVLEWGLPSSEWTFVLDRHGAIAARFEAFATLEELEQALLQVL